MKTYKNYINGQWQAAHDNETMKVINPATEAVIAEVAKSTSADVDDAVQAAKEAFEAWNATSLETRLSYLEKLLQLFKERQEELAQLITQELGASITFAREGHLPTSINEMAAFIEEAKTYPFESKIKEDTILKEGVGVVAAITPWNYPINQIQRKLSPALLAGNTVVIKPASNTPLSALIYAEMLHEVGIPKGVVNVVTGSGSEVGDYLAGHEEVALISFTGSTDVGRGLYAKAAPTIKKLVLELGGKSALVYLKGGDPELAVKRSLDTLINNSGQTCSALSRLLIPKDEQETFEELLLKYYDEIVIGDPTNEKTTLGPMVSQAQKERVEHYIQIGKEEGARVLAGGGLEERTGYYVQPTIFVDVDNAMTIAQEEIFGPVLVVIPYEDEAEALEIANDSIYGLSGCVVGPEEKARNFARKIRSGNVFINDHVKSPYTPFGGYKQSGLGRETGRYGIDDYVEVKAII